MTESNSSSRFGSTDFQPSLLGLVKFELKSRLGRVLSSRRVPGHKYLQLGCGPNLLQNFDNLDFYVTRFWKAGHTGHDLRYPLPYADQCFFGAYSEHTLEHLYPDQAMRLLSEIHRVLAPGAIFRCAVPDLEKYLDFYMGREVDGEFREFRSGCEAIWSLTQNWGHLSVWDFRMLAEKLREAGFSRVEKRVYRAGGNPDLLVDLEARKWETLYVEATR
jgi:SAM-dependent methyltransferase